MVTCKKCGDPIYSLVHYFKGKPYHEPCAKMLRNYKKNSSEKAGDIEIKKDKALKGTIKWFSNGKGYGFISVYDGNDFFFHVTNVRGTKLPNAGDSVKFNPREGKKGKSAATDIEIISPRLDHNSRPYYGKNVQRTEVVEHGNSSLGVAAGFGVLGAIAGGPIGGIIGAVLGGVLSEDKDDVTKQVEITSPCIRCGGKGHVTARVDDRTGFQCPICKSFWKVADHQMPPEDLAALKEIDFTNR